MSIVNTGVNYPIERGGTGKFKALSTVTSASYTLTSAAPIVIKPASGNAILLFGLIGDVVANTYVSGSLYGDVVSNKSLSETSNTAGYFYLSTGQLSSAGSNIAVNNVPSIQFETDEVVTISRTSAGSATVYVSYQEGYIL